MRARVSTKVLVTAISLIAGFSFLIAFAVQETLLENQSYSYDATKRAAILDQLYDDIPSEDFQVKAKQYLQDAGYEVDLFTTQQLTVDFYKKLPKMNYEFIVVRSHAIGSDGPDYFEKEPVSIFTGEKYADDRYIQEQLFGQLGKGAPYMSSKVDVSVDLSGLNQNSSNVVEASWSLVDTTNPYFLVGSKYVDELMEGKFPNSVIVLGGCSTLSNPSLAESLVNRGASSVVGWDRLIGSVKNDEVVLAFLEGVLANDMNADDAVQFVNEKYYLDSESKPTFVYYGKSI